MTDTAEVKTATMETTSALPAEETERIVEIMDGRITDVRPTAGARAGEAS